MKLANLPLLRSFPKKSVIAPEKFGEAIKQLGESQEVVLFAEEANLEGAEIYKDTLEMPSMIIESVKDPIQAASKLNGRSIPIFIKSAIDPTLKDSMFMNDHGEQLFADHVSSKNPNHESLMLHTIGVSKQALEMVLPLILNNSKSIEQLIDDRSARIKAILGNDIIPYGYFRKMLKGNKVDYIPIHALGPQGTNISLVAREYVQRHLLDHKARCIIHPRGIEPLEYAELAKNDKQEGTVPIHVECAVYYDMKKLYEQRIFELVFIDYHYMLLDEMQLAVRQEFEMNLSRIPYILTSHPSPHGLIAPWEKSGIVKWIKAPSNSAASQMVQNGEADLCITTNSGRVDSNLEKVFSFGSPPMIFTFGTSLNKEEIKRYL